MALAKLACVAVEGIEALSVGVEVDVARGLPGFVVVGLADKAVAESRERVRAAVKHTGYDFPLARITVNLAPSERQKSGLQFDLPIALGILLADNQLKKTPLWQSTLFLGGLSLDGQLQPIFGSLTMVEWARRRRFERVVLPRANWQEASLVEGIELVPAESLRQVIDWLGGRFTPLPVETITSSGTGDNYDIDWLQIQGQEKAKRAAIISAAGGHNLLLEGPPGAGKSLLARGLRAILPPLETSELLEVVRLHSVAGQIPPNEDLSCLPRPFRSPHHSASHIALVGGGTNPRPGEISLAHRGVLFLDELPEFPRQALEALRQPLEDGKITVARIQQSLCYPAEFILVATMNPCPCGWFNSGQRECNCSPHERERYRKKISGPIMDRIDLYAQLPAVPLEKLRAAPQEASTLSDIRARVAKARARQIERQKCLNSRLSPAAINKICQLEKKAERLLEEAARRFVISGRGLHKLLKVARTIADLEQQEIISQAALAEALQYRQLERLANG